MRNKFAVHCMGRGRTCFEHEADEVGVLFKLRMIPMANWEDRGEFLG